MAREIAADSSAPVIAYKNACGASNTSAVAPYRTEPLLTLLRSMLDKNRTGTAATSLVSLR